MPFFLQSVVIFPYAMQTFNKKCNFADGLKFAKFKSYKSDKRLVVSG